MLNKHQVHERRLTVDRRDRAYIDRRAMIRFEPGKEPRRSGHDRRRSDSWEQKQYLA